MKKITFLFWFLVVFGQMKGQTSNQSLQDNLVRLYNNSDYQGFYNLGSSEWKLCHDYTNIIGWLKWMHNQTGNLSSWKLMNDTGKYQLIRWEGEHKVTGFMLRPGKKGEFNDFNFVPLSEPLSLRRQ